MAQAGDGSARSALRPTGPDADSAVHEHADAKLADDGETSSDDEWSVVGHFKLKVSDLKKENIKKATAQANEFIDFLLSNGATIVTEIRSTEMIVADDAGHKKASHPTADFTLNLSASAAPMSLIVNDKIGAGHLAETPRLASDRADFKSSTLNVEPTKLARTMFHEWIHNQVNRQVKLLSPDQESTELVYNTLTSPSGTFLPMSFLGVDGSWMRLAPEVSYVHEAIAEHATQYFDLYARSRNWR